LHKHLDVFVLKHDQPTHHNTRTNNNVGHPLVPVVDGQPMSPTRTNLNFPIVEMCSPIIMKRKGRPHSTGKKSCSEKGGKRKKSFATCQVSIHPTIVSEMHKLFDLRFHFHFLEQFFFIP